MIKLILFFNFGQKIHDAFLKFNNKSHTAFLQFKPGTGQSLKTTQGKHLI